jgi:ketosteroid isomerase-like protein
MTGLSTAAAATGSTELEGECAQIKLAQNANIDLLRSAYKQWAMTKGITSDMWMPMLADDLKFGSLAAGAAHVAYLNNYDSKQALCAYFEGVSRHWSMIHHSADEFIANGDVVIMRGKMAWQNKRTGKVCTSPKMDYWRFRDGKVVEFFEFYDTAGVQAASID